MLLQLRWDCASQWEFGLSSTCLRRVRNRLNNTLIDCTLLITRIAAMPCPVLSLYRKGTFHCSSLFLSGNVFIFPFLPRSKTSQRLISHDIHSNTYNYKSTFSVEIVPVCKVHSSRLIISVGLPLEFHTALFFSSLFFLTPRCPCPGYQDNVVCLSPRLAQSLGNMGQVCVCVRVTSTIHLIDPTTLQSECCPVPDWVFLPPQCFYWKPNPSYGLRFLIVERLFFALKQCWGGFHV